MKTELEEQPETAIKEKHGGIKLYVRKFYCTCWPKVNWDHLVGACQNAQQMLHQKSKQFTQHWQSRTEGKLLRKYAAVINGCKNFKDSYTTAQHGLKR